MNPSKPSGQPSAAQSNLFQPSATATASCPTPPHRRLMFMFRLTIVTGTFCGAALRCGVVRVCAPIHSESFHLSCIVLSCIVLSNTLYIVLYCLVLSCLVFPCLPK